MTAGHVYPPIVVPLRTSSTKRAKSHIDTNTFIELYSESPNTDIYFTTDGNVPNVNNKNTTKYLRPILLKKGKQMVKSKAVRQDGLFESTVVTKIFQVDEAPPPKKHSKALDNLAYQKASMFKHHNISEAWLPESTNIDSTTHDDVISPDLKRGIMSPKLKGIQEKMKYLRKVSHVSKSGDSTQISFDSNENPIKDSDDNIAQNGLSSSFTTKPKICHNCNTENPFYLVFCSKCEENLRPKALTQVSSVPVSPTRIFESGIRKMSSLQTYSVSKVKLVKCILCNAYSQSGVNFCHNCGFSLNATAIPIDNNLFESEMSPKSTTSLESISLKDLSELDEELLNFLNDIRIKKTYTSVSTQTVGMYYISAKGLEQKTRSTSKPETIKRLERHFSDTDISPGKGFWRMQLEHILQHIKTYALNQAEFKNKIGDMRIGKISRVRIDEQKNHIHFDFDFFSHTEFMRKKERRVSQYAQNIYQPKVVIQKPMKKSKVGPKKKKLRRKYFSFVKKNLNHRLLEELSDVKKGNVEYVQKLLKRGANPNCESNFGLTPLCLAAIKNILPCIPVLINSGANINQKMGLHENTALHETALVGPLMTKIIKILLSFGADPYLKNKRGETVGDLATKMGFGRIFKMLVSDAKQVMDQQLSHLEPKQKQNLIK